MKLEISNNRQKIKITLIGALIGFGLSFIAAPFILNSVYGIKPLDEGYRHYTDGTIGGIENTPYQDFIANGCFVQPNTGVEKTLTMSTRGLDELGLPYYDPNTCFDIAMGLAEDYNIDSVTVDKDGFMVITLTKK